MSNLKMSLAKMEPIMNEVLDSGGEFTMIINGTSMLPLLVQGKDAVVLLKKQPEKNDIILYKREDGSFILHRIVGKDKHGYILCGDNQFIKEYGVNCVIAVVIAFIKDGKRININDIRYRFYVNSLFIRRAYMKTRRVLRCKMKDNT